MPQEAANPPASNDEKAEQTPSRTSDATLVPTISPDPESCDQPPRKLNWLSRLLSKKTCVVENEVSGKGVDDSVESTEERGLREYSVITDNLETSPLGYARVATFQSSDRNFLQYRGFNKLHCRLLSVLQYEVEQLEKELNELDECDNNEQIKHTRKLTSQFRDRKHSPEDLANGGHYKSSLKRSRPEVLDLLRSKLLEYDEVLLKTKEVNALQRPSKRDYEGVRRWFKVEEPIFRSEAQFIRRKEDIVTLRTGRESAGFDSFIERCLGVTDEFLQKRLKCRLIQYLFLTPELRAKCLNDEVRYFAATRIDTLVNILITIVIFILLVLPVVIMYEVTNIAAEQSALDAIGVLVVFTLIFGMAVSSLTTAKRQELFGASAAYCAVLVVFISNFGIQEVEMVKPFPS